tara:strand:- start:429 stop:1358 length:930 start_codon:yes stop_codon:yes gene_type:complete
MPSTYTTNLRLTKQADGENPNTWGEVLNEGMISLVDHAIAGYTSISVGTTATVTLTENQGSGDQSRSAVLEFKGTIGGSHNNIDVLIPNNSKLYVVKNSITYTDSTDSLVLKVAGNTGVTIPAGTVALYVTNGVTTQAVEKTNLSSLTVTGAARFDSTVTVSGAADFKTNISVGGTFIATGASRFDSTVTVSGKGKFTTGAFTPIVTLTDAASVATDLNTGNVFYVTLGGNRTLAAPTETTTNIGAVGQIFIQQDGTGSRTLSYNTVFQFPGASVPVLSTAANAVDTLFYAVRTTTKVDAILVKNFNRS